MPQTPAQPRLIRQDLGTPDAMVVKTTGGEVVVVADHAVTDAQLDVIFFAAEYLPAIPTQSRHEGD